MNPEHHKAAVPVVQTAASDVRQHDAPAHYQGFSLRRVTWGYRELFANAIESLFQQGCLGPKHQEVTDRFFDLLKRSDQHCFDHVLHQFIIALTPQNRWIMEIPGIFSDLVDLGTSLAEDQIYYGTRFFETLANGGMGKSPQEVRTCLDGIRRLRTTDDDLAMAFLGGYKRLTERLQSQELDRYIEVGIRIHHGNKQAGCSFLRGELSSSESYIRTITQECRLDDMAEHLKALLKALTGDDFVLASLGELDSDELFEHGSHMLAVSGHLYLPDRIRRFDNASQNRHWYMLCAIVSATMLLEDSFPRVHGHPQYRTCAALTGDERWRQNLFQIMEFVRVLRRACRRWPGVRRLIALGIQTELAETTVENTPLRLLADAMNETSQTPVVEAFCRQVDACVNCFDTASRLDEPGAKRILSEYPSLTTQTLHPISFISDFCFPVDFSETTSDQIISDLKDAARKRQSKPSEDAPPALAEGSLESEGEAAAEARQETTPAANFLYDEWDVHQNDYRPSWCHVQQQAVERARTVHPGAEWMETARKVKAVFERLKPDIARREKRLEDGDNIDTDLLLDHLVDRCREPCPPARFYERPIINHRDLAVLILLDVSGSTGGQLGTHTKVLDIEKQASVILGQGLSVLGDRFSVCGFSSFGREQCEYLVFKSFEDDWSDATIGRVMAAWPRSSTRMGPAIRHSGYLLARQPHRQRLIILVTDGKPMDQGYDPATRYAQHDVRMACEEIARQDIHTFAISTEENSVADMEIMFPHRRFAILPDMRHLPDVLPRFYIQMTVR